MNAVALIGRLTKDPDVRYGSTSQTAAARFSLAIDRGKDRNGNNLGTDYPSIVCFGKTAELVEKFLTKGRLVGVHGRIQTGSYEKNGQKVYTTEVVADRVEFLDKSSQNNTTPDDFPLLDGFNLTDDEIPF